LRYQLILSLIYKTVTVRNEVTHFNLASNNAHKWLRYIHFRIINLSLIMCLYDVADFNWLIVISRKRKDSLCSCLCLFTFALAVLETHVKQ